ncbi:MAG: low molecular weight protein-tyrosine-phosphatase [Gammaproteobacteria bacterium]
MNESIQPIRVLFVCMGNICRSPTGEGVFRHYVMQAGHEPLIHIDSAGTIGFHAGNPPDIRMSEAASRRGYMLDSRARQVRAEDIEGFDLIISMDHDNLMDLHNLAGGSRPHIRMLGSYLDGQDSNETAPPVPDPYYGGPSGFDEVLDMIESACPAILEHCLELMREKQR